jgi:hypothetical protein
VRTILVLLHLLLPLLLLDFHLSPSSDLPALGVDPPIAIVPPRNAEKRFLTSASVHMTVVKPSHPPCWKCCRQISGLPCGRQALRA